MGPFRGLCRTVLGVSKKASSFQDLSFQVFKVLSFQVFKVLSFQVFKVFEFSSFEFSSFEFSSFEFSSFEFSSFEFSRFESGVSEVSPWILVLMEKVGGSISRALCMVQVRRLKCKPIEGERTQKVASVEKGINNIYSQEGVSQTISILKVGVWRFSQIPH